MRYYKKIFLVLFFLLCKNAFADSVFTQAKFLDYHGQDVYVKEKKRVGKNNLPVVVLLNSVSLPSVEAFDIPHYSLMEKLANAGYDVWGFDFINQGHSTFSETLPLTPENALKQLEFVLQEIRKESSQKTVTLLGWSWGTIIASQYAIVHPDEVNHLVLYAAMYSSPMPEPQQKMITGSRDSMPATQPVAWQMIQHHWDNMLSGTEKERNHKAMEDVSHAYCRIQNEAACTVTRLKEQMLALIDAWTGKPPYAAQNITVPTLVIYGDGDFFADKVFFNQLTQAKYKEQFVIHDASHWLLYEEKSNLFYQSVINFLGTHE